MTNDQSKHFQRWLHSLEPDYLLTSRVPWITFDAFDYLETHLPPDIRVFEWGSGGSTLYWLSRGASHVVSIEHDPGWFMKMSSFTNGSSNLDYRLILPEPLPTGSIQGNREDPDAYATDDPELSTCTFRKYASEIDGFPRDFFDLIMIDGRSRPSCVKHGSGKVRIGGMVILDNADRSYYLSQAAIFLENFSKMEFAGLAPAVGILCQTNIYVRIK